MNKLHLYQFNTMQHSNTLVDIFSSSVREDGETKEREKCFSLKRLDHIIIK